MPKGPMQLRCLTELPREGKGIPAEGPGRLQVSTHFVERTSLGKAWSQEQVEIAE